MANRHQAREMAFQLVYEWSLNDKAFYDEKRMSEYWTDRSKEDEENKSMELTKTLIGKNDFLFLINDSAKELESHCNNISTVYNKTLSRYKFNNYIMFVYPNKSYILKEHLPNNYIIK